MYWLMTGHRPKLKHPKSYNEIIQYQKIHDHNPIYEVMADKFRVREYVESKIGSEVLIPLLGVYDSVQDIPFHDLPERYVIMCNHDSGSVVICKDRKTFNINKAKNKLTKHLRTDFSLKFKEWQYHAIPRKLLVYQYLEDESGSLNDYKIFVLGGKARFIQVDLGRFTKHVRNIYDTDWNLLPFTIGYPNGAMTSKPTCLDKILHYAEVLASDIPQARCDFYVVNDHIYFGEITLSHTAGYDKFTPNEWGEIFGSYIPLPSKIAEKRKSLEL
jgi:hypothetical protein